MDEAAEAAHWRTEHGESSLLRRLRALRDNAMFESESRIYALQAGLAAGGLVLLGALVTLPLIVLHDSLPTWLSWPLMLLAFTGVTFSALAFAETIGKKEWQMFRLDYERASAALRATDLPAVIADDELRGNAYERMLIPELPRWLRDQHEPLERHVLRAAAHFDRLLAYADVGRRSEYWRRLTSSPLPERTALIAIADFYLDQDALELLAHSRCAESITRNVDADQVLLNNRPGPADIGGHVRLERQRYISH